MASISRDFTKLIAIISKLRGDNGCPWDKKQTPHSLTKYLKEEISELIQAIENDDPDNIIEEVGDVLYVLLMVIVTHQTLSYDSIQDTLQSITKKLIRRHPHVFENVTINSDEELRQQWEKIKKEEKSNN